MDPFLEGCQGLGLALAAGAAGGAIAAPVSPRRASRLALMALVAVAGALLFGASLTEADHPAWPGWPVGAAAAAGAFALSRSVVFSAALRLDGVTATGLVGMVVAGAAVLAVLSIVVPPISLAALAAGAWLWISRRRKAGQKHKGLRVLR